MSYIYQTQNTSLRNNTRNNYYNNRNSSSIKHPENLYNNKNTSIAKQKSYQYSSQLKKSQKLPNLIADKPNVLNYYQKSQTKYSNIKNQQIYKREEINIRQQEINLNSMTKSRRQDQFNKQYKITSSTPIDRPKITDNSKNAQTGKNQESIRSLYKKQNQIVSNFLRQIPQSKQQIFYKQNITYKGSTIGLTNIGNTCFMNATLQCLLNLPSFNQHFANNKHLKEGQGRVAIAYGKLVQTIQYSRNRAQTPSQLKMAVSSKKSQFQGYGQQDAQQFLSGLLQLLSQELNRSKNPKYKELKADLNTQSLQQISNDWWNYNKQRQNSIVVDYFGGQLLSNVTCFRCGYQSVAFDNAWDYALNFSAHDGGQLIKMLDFFTKQQTIAKDYYCIKCKDFNQCKRKFTFYRMPQILVLQLKRFSYGKYIKQKLKNKVKIPLILDFSKLRDRGRGRYELVGIVHHSGQINYGHYTAECKNIYDEKWYNFNDSSVYPTSMSDPYESSNPYLLFYNKI